MGNIPRRKPAVESKAIGDGELTPCSKPDDLDLSIPAFLKREYDPDKVLPGLPSNYRPFKNVF